uniref:B650e n=1 Tax=Mycobacterium leprae TaxID=1769 RepID=Q50116_MYCLR|nr:hypothetical protein [Mycobacterium leprae]AAA63080.1 b650e [Mycobacterium leprae]
MIRCAAEVEGIDFTNFTITLVLAHARDVVIGRPPTLRAPRRRVD